MNTHLHRLTLIALTTSLAALTACGGGGGGDSTTPAATTTAGTDTTATPAPAAAPAASPSALNGKSLYQANCASCHGGNPAQNISKVLKGTAPGNTLNAIASNAGGMGYLSGTIGAAQANDIAAYLAQPNI
ncbi:c-type cytochrome [Hydrogenophaga sp. RWCD_12]|uniref:c-type cytochrome n=1 Tax=Hydrogenophaga sp. RWCD_12 TaxID=3391190 RepID=UPI003984D0B9